MPYDGPIISRAEARAAGSRYFFTGKACRRGHVAQRYVAQQLCCQCARDFAQGQRDRDPVGTAAAAKAWRATNPERFKAYIKAYAEAYYVAHKERMDAYRADWRRANKDKTYRKTMAWRAANRERWDQAARQWMENNRERVQAIRQNRRGRVRSNGGSFTPEQIKELHQLQKFRCVACDSSIRDAYEIDHIVPVAAGGPNDITNIQLLCSHCNRSKGAKTPEEWARRLGRLL